jgi:hypothetical protein
LLQLEPDDKTPTEPAKPYTVHTDIVRELRAMADGFSRVAELLEGID